ncbi:MAG: type II toxin-antitoxin system RelE/ParE family toxin [Bacteroidetes bacterium]|nr:type II toxin-antitoxin system RelE/ParE family toxin [Bacteroidota bacterium]
MSYSVKSIPVFEKQAKRLIKKYASLKHEIWVLVKKLEENPEKGIPIGRNCYKVRISIASKGKGKRGGGRIITNLVVKNNVVYLLAIYEKTEKENITDKEVIELLKDIPE